MDPFRQRHLPEAGVFVAGLVNVAVLTDSAAFEKINDRREGFRIEIIGSGGHHRFESEFCKNFQAVGEFSEFSVNGQLSAGKINAGVHDAVKVFLRIFDMTRRNQPDAVEADPRCFQ